MLWVASAIAFACAAFPRPVAAVCVVMSLDDLLVRETIIAVFSGTVQQVESVPAGQIVTLAVDRVWKGQVDGRSVVYNRQEPGADEQITFAPKTRYFVVAYRPIATERAAFGMPAEGGDLLATNFCAAHEFDNPGDRWVQQVLRGAPGHPPEERGGVAVRNPRPGPIRKTHDARPVWPEAAQRANIRGTVLVEFTIAIDGSVTDARILRGIPLLDEAALECVRQWRYEPVLLAGRPFPMHITAAVSFP